MLTDIFANRYVDVPLRDSFTELDRRLIVQAFRIINEQLYPPMVGEKKSEPNEEKWKTLHDRMSTELGVNELYQRWYSYQDDAYGKSFTRRGYFDWSFVCKTWLCKDFEASFDSDQFVKNRLSFIEIAFREKEHELAERRRRLDNPDPGEVLLAKFQAKERMASDRAYVERILEANEAAFHVSVDELNTRFRQAGYRLNYHNGFIQFVGDEKVEEEIETPFWALVSDPKWQNVDTDMKEAIDRRDAKGRDPAWYAARALESTIKIISDENDWTHGGEKGAHNYIDNIGSRKNGQFIAEWERDALKKFFTDVRAPFGHGPGSDPMPELAPEQTDWAIEFCMSWIKSLIKRA